MCPDRSYFVYILASTAGVLYTGCTSDLYRRVYQHKHQLLGWFTKQYGVHRLVYYEVTSNSRGAVSREREIKSWTREKKLRLIETVNAGWIDLAADWFPSTTEQDPSLRSG